jgi:hypothetical protein
MSRRRLLCAVAGATALAGCTGSAEQSDVTTTETTTETTTTEGPSAELERVDYELHDTTVGTPFKYVATLKNVGDARGGGVYLSGLSIVDVADHSLGSVNVRFGDWSEGIDIAPGETITKTMEVEYGTDHETTLLVHPGTIMTFGEGEFDLEPVEVET